MKYIGKVIRIQIGEIENVKETSNRHGNAQLFHH